MRSMAIALGIVFLAAPAPETYLAMHTVPVCEYLYCPELTQPPYCPMDAWGLEPEATYDELVLACGYVYIVFCAYAEYYIGISGAEFCVEGWPTGQGAPPHPTMHYCPGGSVAYGDPFAGGGLHQFGTTLEQQSCTGGALVGFSWTGFFALDYCGVLPITLGFCPSTYTYPENPHNYVIGPGPECVEDPVIGGFGCVIGSLGPTTSETSTWGAVKAMYR
jgi:hypothetical protein